MPDVRYSLIALRKITAKVTVSAGTPTLITSAKVPPML